MRVDVLHLLRNLRRSPASAAAAVLSLSLTLGAGASIFAVVDAVVLTPPPFTNPDALVTIGEQPLADRTAAPRAVGYATFDAWRERAGSRAAIEAFDPSVGVAVAVLVVAGAGAVLPAALRAARTDPLAALRAE